MVIDRSQAISQGPYGKMVQQLKAVALEYWANWRPREMARLNKEGRLQEMALKAATRTFLEIDQLRLAGFQIHETEDVVMPRYIILKPEKQVKGELERILNVEDLPE